jgi:ABC-type polysaccharide/polyol phosphate export permease
VTAFVAPGRLGAVVGEAAKLEAFLRRDLLQAWSYRLAFVSEWVSIAVQTVMFWFVGKLIDSDALPTYGGSATTYMEFAAIGIAVGAFIQLALTRVAIGIRGEQMMGTLESLLSTPTSPTTIQFGTVLYDMLYIPIRTLVFLGLAAAVFDLGYHADGVVPAIAVLVAFIPVVWGLGIANAGAVLTFRRGGSMIGFGATMLTLFSGAFFPVEELPDWLQWLAVINPVAIAIDGMREALIGGGGWSVVWQPIATLVPFAVCSVAVGMWLFHIALRRERRRGTLGLY